MDDLRRMRERRGACEPGTEWGRSDCEEDRRAVVGGESERRAVADWCGGEGVAMEAELDVSGECIEGRLGAGSS